MENFRKHLIEEDTSLKDVLQKLNNLAADAILFVVDSSARLIGSLTDGDVRRGFLKGFTFTDPILKFVEPNPRFLKMGKYSMETLIEYRNKNFKILPVVDDDMRVTTVINFRLTRSLLPVNAVIMAGGRGERLKPLTDTTPKPMLQVGNKPIIRYNLDRLLSFGVNEIWISVRYLGNQIEDHLGSGAELGARIHYIRENDPMGTIGAVSQVEDFPHQYVLVSNSDLLTNLDYEDFFIDFIRNDAALSVVTIPYKVNVPYAVLETVNGHVVSFKEKPSYTYYSNGGIYLVKKEVLKRIPRNTFFNATDLMEQLIKENEKVISYPMYGYWLDIGKPDDYIKAQEDHLHIKF